MIKFIKNLIQKLIQKLFKPKPFKWDIRPETVLRVTKIGEPKSMRGVLYTLMVDGYEEPIEPCSRYREKSYDEKASDSFKAFVKSDKFENLLKPQSLHI